MKTIDIVTSHNVTIEYQLASVLDRFLALLIDMVLLLVWFLFSYLLTSDLGNHWETWFSLLFTPFFFAYHLCCEIFFGGQSLGKKALHIKVVRLNGQNPRISDCFMRWVFRIIDIGGTVGALAALFASASDKGQRLGDMIAGTVVIRLNPSNRYTIQDILSIRSTAAHGEPQYPQVVRFTDEDMLLIKNTLERVKLYPNESHHRMVETLTRRVCEDLQVPEPKDDKAVFLRMLLQDYIVLTR